MSRKNIFKSIVSDFEAEEVIAEEDLKVVVSTD